MKKTLAIAIPNYNGKKLLEKNLPFVIRAAKKENASVYFFDDASGDGSADFIKSKYPHIILQPSSIRHGYVQAVNLLIKTVEEDVVILLNTDVRPEENFIRPLLHHFSDPCVFAVGCLDESVEHGCIIKRGRGIGGFYRGQFLHRKGEPNRDDTLWVSGGSAAFRRATWLVLGGYDEVFSPFYYEDIDLSYRAQKAGYKILFEPKSVVIHEHEEGTIKKFYTPFFVKTISYRNQLLFYWKNVTTQTLLVSHIFYLPYYFLMALLRFDGAYFLGFIFALARITQILKYRIQQKLPTLKTDYEIMSKFSEEFVKAL